MSLNFELQTRDSKTGEIKHLQEGVDSGKVAIVIVDPWNYHWCMTRLRAGLCYGAKMESRSRMRAQTGIADHLVSE